MKTSIHTQQRCTPVICSLLKPAALALMAAVPLLWSCTDEQDTDTASGVAAQITASISGTPVTRAIGNIWQTTDVIGVRVAASPQSDMVNKYANVPYTPTISSDGTTATFSGTDIYFPNSYENVTFTAYAPYQTTNANSILPGTAADGIISFTADDIVEGNASTDAQQQKIDFLYDEAKANIANPTVNFTFNHVMTKLKLVFTMGGNTLTFENLKKYATFKFLDINLTGTFDMTSGEVAMTSDTTDEWDFTSLYHTDDDANSTRTYELIVPPQTLGDNVIIIQVSIYGIDLMAAIYDDLESGYEYTYNITVNEDGSSLTVTDVSVSVSDWGDGSSHTLTY